MHSVTHSSSCRAEGNWWQCTCDCFQMMHITQLELCATVRDLVGSSDKFSGAE